MTRGYLGIIAEIKAGKGTVADIVAELVSRNGGTTQLINYSDPMRDCLKVGLTHVVRDRDAYQRFAVGCRDVFGPDVWAKEVDFRARQSTARFVVLAGMRWPPDLPLVKALPNSYALYLTAPQQKRWEWTRAKNEKPGDAEKTWEQFQLEDKAETERYIGDIGKQADGFIRNDGTLDDLRRRVHLLLRDRFGFTL